MFWTVCSKELNSLLSFFSLLVFQKNIPEKHILAPFIEQPVDIHILSILKVFLKKSCNYSQAVELGHL